jgi:hypothetical protein
MKNQRTFSYLLMLCLAGVSPITYVGASIAQNSSDQAQNIEKSKKSKLPSASPNTSTSPVTDDRLASPSTSSSPILGDDPASPSGTPSTSSAAVEGVTQKNDNSLWWWGASGLLHLLEIACIVFAFRGLFRLEDKNNNNAQQLANLVKELSTYETNQKAQGNQLKSISSDVATTRGLTSRVSAIDKQLSAQQDNRVSSHSNPSSEPRRVESAKAIPVNKSAYPFLDKYRQSPEIFKNQYSPSTVSEDAENLQKRWGGDQQEIILGEDRQGNYWLFNEGSLVYLIPNPKLKVNDMNMRTAGGLFECLDYSPGYSSMTIIEPAIVSIQTGSNRRWKLEQKGVLGFT